MSIQRWDAFDMASNIRLEKSDGGEYVEYADHKAALAEKEAELASSKAHYKDQMGRAVGVAERYKAELEKARELLRRGRIAAQFMANEKLDNDIKAYLGDKT